MRRIVLASFIGSTLLVATAFIPAVRDEVRWWIAQLRDTERAYHDYEDAWPRGRFRQEAQDRLERRLWSEAVQSNTVSSYQRYLDDVENGQHSKDAERRQQLLQQDDEPFQAAARRGTADAWGSFLQDFRGHRRTGEALAALALAEPDSIFGSARAGKLTVSARGELLYRFSVILRKSQPENLAVSVPRGTYFRARDPRVQDMVATHGFDHDLAQDGEVWCPTPVAGASMRKRLATRQDEFTLVPSPPKDDLARLIAYFAFKMPEFRLRQAAIWIVTDNATWSDLKRHLLHQTGADPDIITGDEDKVFDAGEAVNAIQILDAAGLDPKRFAIWNARREIFWELLAQDQGEWQWLAETDSGGIGQEWQGLKNAMSQRLASADSTLTGTLKAHPVEVTIGTPGRSPDRTAAWLAWYLRGLGQEVDVHADGEPSDGYLIYGGKLRRQGLAIARLMELALGLRRRKTSDSNTVAFRGKPPTVFVLPKGTNDFEKRRKATEHTPKFLRWIP